MGNMDVMLSSKTPEWSTPRDFFRDLDIEFGGFDLDVASTDENALCKRHYTIEDDGLSLPWEGTVWCNPPYGRSIGDWMRKAALDNEGGVTVCLVPARVDTRWWNDWVVGHATEVRFVRGRLKFGGSPNAAPFPSAVVIYDKRRRGNYWSIGCWRDESGPVGYSNRPVPEEPIVERSPKPSRSKAHKTYLSEKKKGRIKRIFGRR